MASPSLDVMNGGVEGVVSTSITMILNVRKSCYVSDSGLLERNMISRANERMSDEASRSYPCETVMHEREYRTAICPLLGPQDILFCLLLGALFVLSEALRSLKAGGSVWDELRCVLAILLR
ncbi:hypothetical protein Tco_0112113 [Tanacetum coccineum]